MSISERSHPLGVAPTSVERLEQELCERLDLIGQRLNPASRFFEYKRHVSRFHEHYSSIQSIELEAAQAHLRICRELEMIAISTMAFPRSAESSSLLAKTLAGNLFAEQDRDPSARNFQFELVSAGLFRHAGFDCEMGEPDFTVGYGVRRLGVAAKRVSSVKKIVSRIKEGVSQLSRAALDGIVAIDLTSHVVDPKAIDVFGSDGQVRRRAGEAIGRFTSQQIEPHLADCDSRLIGVLCFCRAFGVESATRDVDSNRKRVAISSSGTSLALTTATATQMLWSPMWEHSRIAFARQLGEQFARYMNRPIWPETLT